MMRSLSSPRAVSRMIGRRAAVRRADAAHHLQAVDAGQHEIEHQRSGSSRSAARDRRRAVGGVLVP